MRGREREELEEDERCRSGELVKKKQNLVFRFLLFLPLPSIPFSLQLLPFRQFLLFRHLPQPNGFWRDFQQFVRANVF